MTRIDPVAQYTPRHIMNTRRNFLLKLVASAGAPTLIASRALGQDTPPPVKMEESDPLGIALGYKEDTTKVDATKYPQHKPDQKCSNCALYTGKEGDPTGPCTIFGNKIVTADGWCATWAKKPEPAKLCTIPGFPNHLRVPAPGARRFCFAKHFPLSPARHRA